MVKFAAPARRPARNGPAGGCGILRRSDPAIAPLADLADSPGGPESGAYYLYAKLLERVPGASIYLLPKAAPGETWAALLSLLPTL